VATSRPEHLRHLGVALGVAAVVVVADQVTKSLAESRLRHPEHVFGPFGLALGYNTGSAFSLFSRQTPLVVVLAVALVGVLAWVAFRTTSTATAVAVGLMLGGALGNLADRLFRDHQGAVVDFITLTHWPTFNVGDACITVGALVLLLSWGRQSVQARPRS
jgi:signal peptidase II